MTYSQSQRTMRTDRMRIVDNVHLFFYFLDKMFIYLFTKNTKDNNMNEWK